MLVDIIIPTCTGIPAIVVEEICKTRITKGELWIVATPESAAKNRNRGLKQAVNADIIIMLDDDIRCFFTGWDSTLIAPLLNDKNLLIVAARLVDKQGRFARVNGCTGDYTTPIVRARNNILSSACIAFRKTCLRFDENYVGGGFEDTDFCYQMLTKYPYGYNAINNQCILVHLHELKNQMGHNFSKNKAYFLSKWGNVPWGG